MEWDIVRNVIVSQQDTNDTGQREKTEKNNCAATYLTEGGDVVSLEI